MSSFDELLARLLDEPEDALGILSDIVNRGRLQADDIPPGLLEVLARHELVVFLVERRPRQRLRTWVYPSPLGLKTYAVLEREAERVEHPVPPPSGHERRG